MDSDDEPMVTGGRFTPWLHADSTVIDSAQPTPSICEVARNPGPPRLIRSDLAATQVDVEPGPLQKGFKGGLKPKGVWVQPPYKHPFKPNPVGAPGGGGEEETRVNPNKFGFHCPPSPYKPKGVLNQNVFL